MRSTLPLLMGSMSYLQQTFECRADDLKEEAELGRGAYGSVYKMRHTPTDTLMAVKVS